MVAHHTLLIANEMLIELSGVLRYPRLQKLYGLTDEEVYHYVEYLWGGFEVCRPGSLVACTNARSQGHRGEERVVLQTAVSGEAEIVCTLDTDFYDPETIAFCATWGI